jgi:acylphosphatase
MKAAINASKGSRSVKIRAHVTVTGNVQGVFYRAETASRAKQSNITGWVRNLPDGRVEAIFEGEETNVQKIVDFSGKGLQMRTWLTWMSDGMNGRGSSKASR